MSVSKALKVYSEASPEQKKFMDEKKISATYSIKNWQAFLNKAVALDTIGDKASRALRTRMVWFYVLAGVSFIVGLFYYPLFIGTLIFLILGIFTGVKKKKFTKFDLNNYLREFFFPILEVLKVKAGEGAKLSAQLDFSNPLKDQKPKKYKSRNRDISEFNQKFIIAKIPLKDGVELEFVVADVIVEQRYWKKSASGKNKLKNKSKTVHQYLIKATAPKASFPSLRRKIPDHVFLEETEDAYVLKFKGKQKVQKKNDILSVSVFLEAMQDIYYILEGKEREKIKPRGEDEAAADIDTMEMYMWSGIYFSHYDYDTFDREGGAIYEGSDADTFYDS
ncbi:MAG: hypothetical protein OEY51_03310 [Cyclobacteriaceae bacterium]|nr:hypothetical protein [Cyclobacteriaceae bacterium]